MYVAMARLAQWTRSRLVTKDLQAATLRRTKLAGVPNTALPTAPAPQPLLRLLRPPLPSPPLSAAPSNPLLWLLLPLPLPLLPPKPISARGAFFTLLVVSARRPPGEESRTRAGMALILAFARRRIRRSMARFFPTSLSLSWPCCC